VINVCQKKGILLLRFIFDFSGFIVELFKYTEKGFKKNKRLAD